MFTGIIESTAKVEAIVESGSNVDFKFSSSISKELKIDQSVAHDGVCLTVVEKNDSSHVVTAIQETLVRSNLGKLKVGDRVNLERAMSGHARFDGHIVQGHVDAVGICESIIDNNGSWDFRFSFDEAHINLLVDKGSVTINGVSLTVVNPVNNTFGVSIIPYTYEHTSFGKLKVGDQINLEFDIIGKYVAKMMKAYLVKS